MKTEEARDASRTAEVRCRPEEMVVCCTGVVKHKSEETRTQGAKVAGLYTAAGAIRAGADLPEVVGKWGAIG
jgi:hypothetical protein